MAKPRPTKEASQAKKAKRSANTLSNDSAALKGRLKASFKREKNVKKKKVTKHLLEKKHSSKRPEGSGSVEKREITGPKWKRGPVKQGEPLTNPPRIQEEGKYQKVVTATGAKQRDSFKHPPKTWKNWNRRDNTNQRYGKWDKPYERRKKKKKHPLEDTKLVVKDLPPNLTKEDLMKAFREATDVSITMDDRSAFIEFASPKSALTALSQSHQKKICGHTLKVRYARKIPEAKLYEDKGPLAQMPQLNVSEEDYDYDDDDDEDDDDSD